MGFVLTGSVNAVVMLNDIWYNLIMYSVWNIITTILHVFLNLVIFVTISYCLLGMNSPVDLDLPQ